MQKALALGVRVGVWGVAGALCTGCPSPQLYGTPRTTPVGKVQHTIALEGIGFRAQYPVPAATPYNPTPKAPAPERDTGPTPPTYQLRIGVADRLDIGLRFANMSLLGADVKWNFIKGELLDLAFVPGAQVSVYDSGRGSSESNRFYCNLPLVIGVNIVDSLTIVPTAGIMLGANSAGSVSNDGIFGATASKGAWLRGGLGFNFRVSSKFAIQPELTVLKVLNRAEDPSVLLYLFGLGFDLGVLPDFGDGRANEE